MVLFEEFLGLAAVFINGNQFSFIHISYISSILIRMIFVPCSLFSLWPGLVL
jgi:hypothetical protein